MTRVADTSVLYAVFDDADAHASRARSDLALPEPIAVPTEILVETTDLLDRRCGRKAAEAALAALLSLPHVRVADQVEIEAVKAIHAASRGKLSLADSIVVQTCRVLGAAPLAYDADISRATR